jgi:hypothetical protein
METIENTDDDVQSTRHDFLIVHAAVMPTRVLPAPHGSTMMPERARLADKVSKRPVSHLNIKTPTYPFPNILLKLVS